MNATSTSCTRPDYARRYIKELLGSMLLFMIAIFFRRYALTHGWWPIGFTLLPAVPLALAIVAMLRMIKKLDEMQRMIQLYAVAIAAMGTAFVSVVFALLEDVGIGPVSLWMIWPLICGLWGISAYILSRRFCRVGPE